MTTPEDAAYRARVEGLYDGRAGAYDLERSRNWGGGSSFRSEVVDFCSEGMRSHPAQVLLDLGAGTGRVLRAMPDGSRNRVIAIDLSWEMLRVLAGAHLPAVYPVRADAHSLPLRRGSIDGILAISVLQYLDLGRAADECRRVLKADAWLRVGVVVVHPEDVENWRHNAFQHTDPPYISKFRRAQQIVAVFERSGLRLQNTATLQYHRRFDELSADKRSHSGLAPVRQGIAPFFSAPQHIRHLYGITEIGFTQHYALMTFTVGP